MKHDFKLSPIWWAVLPLSFFIVSSGMELFADDTLLEGLLIENGAVEILQTIIIALAFITTAFTLPVAIRTKNNFLIGWTLCATIGCFYITGEEISWGQHIFFWSTPENWMVLNDHHETNIHNTTSWLDQKPRTLLEIGILAGNIIIPLWQKIGAAEWLSRFEIILPPVNLWLVATALWITKLSKDLAGVFDINLIRTSELNEVYIYYFILIYMIVFRKRLAALKTSSS